MKEIKEISFGKFRLDLLNECLWQGTRSIPLRPKAFAVLKLLIANPGLLVTKQQVLDAVWPETFVGDAVLKDNIRQLREALHDDSASPTYIETAHRRGYRFIGKLGTPTPSKKTVSTLQPQPARVTNDVAGISPLTTANWVLGRNVELAKMRAYLEKALAGERKTIFITGEPGIGKTTLVQAFLQQAAQVEGLLVARGQCLEHYGAAEPYLPVLDGFARLCRTHEGSQVLAFLRQHAPAWLAQMPSLLCQAEREHLQKQSVGATRERMLREMAEAIEALTAQSPLLLVLEDLHWSDYSTLDLVSYLARRQDSARVVVIGTYRPVDVILSDHPLKRVKRDLQAHDLCNELSLEYLSEESVREYLNVRFPGNRFPLRLRRAIYRCTQGNPLFMVNLIEYLSEQKFVTGKTGSWELGIEVLQVEREVPANLRQLIEQRLDRLSPDERTVLEAASVAGMECSSAAIAAGLENTVEWVEEHCEELARRHQFLSPAWLVELPDGTITPRHRFIHVLYREVPYRLMAPMRRSQLHRRIGERGVAIYGDRVNEIAAELAMHFEQSHEWLRALEFLLQAAENAMVRSADHEAADLANRGLEALAFLPETAERIKQEMKLRIILSVSLMAIKGFASDEVEQVNARGRELFWRQGPSLELFYMLWSLGLYYQFSGKLHSSLEISSQLLELADDLNDGALRMEAHRAMGGALVELGRCAEALQHLDAGTALYATHRRHRYEFFTGRDCRVVCECLAARGLWALGYPDRAIDRIGAALALARELAHPQTLMVAGHFAAQLHQLRGEPQLAQKRAIEVTNLASEYGMELWASLGNIDLGYADAELSNGKQGIAQMQRALDEYEATGAKLRSPYFLGLLADELGKAGRLEEGLTTITNALIRAGENAENYWLADLHRIQGELLLRNYDSLIQSNAADELLEKSRSSQATACFDKALLMAQQQGTRSWQLRAALSIDRLEMRHGKWDHTQLAAIYSSFTEGFETADLKEAKVQLSATPPE